ncbi:ammonia-forming cytochrome c nitrite reductase subunit c552 [Geothrix campi]|jgi:nitrite reductase (cytochrome c-552)|uniref:ammonia-forming cytochrome c nitrite reductase subunit c552 n=1 Tax=Geothrix campi TaxID=2966450 RepID=UPI0021477FAF|nr:ammonia-forming cytochrome c nitrite reductase subunit c552 [Geothrix sp. SG10]
MTDNPTPLLSRPLVRMGLIAAGAALATVLVMSLYASISNRKAEAKQTSLKLVDLDEKVVDPAQWGKNFPREYETYLKTSEKYSTKYGGAGSEALPKSRIQEDPRLVTIFDGYAFSIDFNQRRGHAFMLDDQRNTKRVTERKQPGSCLHCHASNTVAFRELGLQGGAPGTLEEAFTSPNAQAQLMAGFEAMCKLPYAEATKLVKHPVACIDCHDPKNMALRVTKPGFIRGIVALANSPEPVPHLPSIEKWRKGDRSVAYDANRDASRQELRSMVCGQCHVEYYCGPKVTLFFPWNKGLKVEQIEATYDEYKFPDGHRFFDWQHAKTGAEVLKAQHPEFEMWSQGIHARSGVSCADCHMPYVREGALKISDHQVRSPLLNISRSCQTCHRFPEEELKARVTSIQDRTKALMDRAEDAVVNLIDDIAAAKKAGVDEGKLKPIYELQRKAQWRVDFVNAENSMGFHAPQEVARILGEAIDFGRQGQVALRDLSAPKVARK